MLFRSKKYDFSVYWTLTVQTEAGNKVTVKDNAGKVAASGVADAKGKFEALVKQGVYAASGNTMMTPHTVIVEKGAKKVERNVTVDRMVTLAVGL